MRQQHHPPVTYTAAMPCPRCHTSERYRSTRACIYCARRRRAVELIDRDDAERAHAAALRRARRDYLAAVSDGRIVIRVTFPDISGDL